MSQAVFGAPVSGRNVIAGINISDGGTFNANFGTDAQNLDKDKVQLKDFLGHLFLTDPSDDLSRTKRLSGSRVAGSCGWLLARPEYDAWIHGCHQQFFWLMGVPGSGKTVISCFIIEELQRLASLDPNAMLAYYLCDFKDDEKRTATCILRSILGQLLQSRPDLFPLIKEDYARDQKMISSNPDALWKKILQISNVAGVRIYFVIDALDECDKTSRSQLLGLMAGIDSSADIRILITGRPESELMEFDHSTIRLQIKPTNINHDLHRYIDATVNDIGSKKKYPPQFVDEVKTIIKLQAGGTFLWASLILNDIASAKTLRRAKEKLEKIPSNLFNVYQRILDGILEEDQADAALVLQWVVAARRPMTVAELSTAFALSSGEDYDDGMIPSSETLVELKDIFKSCGPILYHDSKNDTISLIHRTAKEFLVTLDGMSPYHVNQQQSTLRSLQICWKYLSMEDFDQGAALISYDDKKRLLPTRLSKRIVKHYAFLAFVAHELLTPELGQLKSTVSLFINQTKDLNTLPVIRDYWLLLETARGDVNAVKALLLQGANPNVSLADDSFMKPLHVAVHYGHAELCEVFLNNIVGDDEYRSEMITTALEYAAGGGHVKVAIMMLERIRAANIRHDSWASFSVSLENESEEIPLLLLDSGFDPKYLDGALDRAAETGRCKVIQKLLEMGASVNMCDEMRFTALAASVDKGHVEAAKLLIDAGSDIRWREIYTGRNLLDLAIYNNDPEMVHLLVGKAVQLEEKLEEQPWVSMGISESRFKYSPLDLASMFGNQAIVDCLVQAGARLPGLTNSGTTALHLAALKNHVPVLRYLLNKGVDASIKDGDGQTALHIAAGLGHDAMVDLLLNRALNVEEQDGYGWTPLHHAAYGERLSTISLLITVYGANTGSRDLDGQTPIHLVARSSIQDSRGDLDWPCRTRLGEERLQAMGEIVQYLLEHGADVDAKNLKGQTALHLVSLGFIESPSRGDPSLKKGADASAEVSQQLISHGADVNSTDLDGRTPLYYAVTIFHQGLIHLLLQNGAMVSLMDWMARIKYPTPDSMRLSVEKYKSSIAETVVYPKDLSQDSGMVQQLLEVLNYETVSREPSFTHLFEAIQGGYPKIVSFLLERKLAGPIPKEFMLAAPSSPENPPLVEQSLPGSIPKEVVAAIHDLSARSGHEEVFRQILRANLNTTCSETLSQCLIPAVEEGCENIVRVLLEWGHESNAVSSQDLDDALITAVCKGHDAIIKLLVDWGARISSQAEGQSLLSLSVNCNNARSFETLLDLGHDIWNLEDYNKTVCHAAKNEMINAVQMMIDCGVDLNKSGNDSLLFAALPTKNEALIQLLLGRGCDANIANQHGKAPLDFAFEMRDSMPIVKLLVRFGADLDKATAKTKLCPLLMRFSELDVISFLKLEPDYFDLSYEEGQKLMTWAIESEYIDLAACLLQKGVKTHVQPMEMMANKVSHFRNHEVWSSNFDPFYQKHKNTRSLPSRSVSIGPGVRVEFSAIGGLIGCKLLHLVRPGERLQYIEW